MGWKTWLSLKVYKSQIQSLKPLQCIPSVIPLPPDVLRIENGMEPQVLKTILGHSKLSMTMVCQNLLAAGFSNIEKPGTPCIYSKNQARLHCCKRA